MLGRRALILVSAALLLELLPRVAAHGDEHGDAHMDMSAPEAPKPQLQDGQQAQTYWRLNEHVALMYWHIGLEVLAWVFVLPTAVMLSIAHSRLTFPSQLLFLSANALALLLGVAYRHQTPDLYANNAHSKTGWIITWIASAWALLYVVQQYARRSNGAQSRDPASAHHPMTTANMARYQRVHQDALPSPYRWSSDSGQGTERNSASLFGHSRSPSLESEEESGFSGPTLRSKQNEEEEEEDVEEDVEKRGFLGTRAVDRFFSQSVARFLVGRTLKVVRACYVVFERTLVVQGFVAIMTGTVVYGGIGKGGAIFNVLAHYIKGGIFFVYGLLTLGRWMGAFADLGWAWNIRPSASIVGRRAASMPSAEFTESFVIFLYGASNVFLEHLAAWGDAWTPQDLEHASISILFFGGGLLGMLIESRKIRNLLNTSVVASQPSEPTTVTSFASSPSANEATADSETIAWTQPRSYAFSLNPLPALTILLLGKMMSGHHQASMLSTMIHAQWGSMFMLFAMARCLTYILVYLSPPRSYLPSRPPTEVITSFCLVAGGMTFMLSNKDTVAALEGYGLDAMFTFTVTVGVTALLMAWTVVVVAVKGWAVQRENATLFAKRRSGVLA